MKKLTAVLITLIMVFSCICISASASYGVANFTDSDTYVHPCARNTRVTVYDADGNISERHTTEYNDADKTETYTYECLDSNDELGMMYREITVYDDMDRTVSVKLYNRFYGAGNELLLSRRSEHTYDGNKEHTVSIAYNADGTVFDTIVSDAEYDDGGRLLLSIGAEYDSSGNLVYQTRDEITYSEDGKTDCEKYSYSEDGENFSTIYYLTERIIDGGNITTISKESDDGKEYTPHIKTEDFSEDALHRTHSIYRYYEDEWQLDFTAEYELDSEDREVPYAFDNFNSYKKLAHVYAPDGMSAVHTYFYEDPFTGEYNPIEKDEEHFTGKYRRSLIKTFAMEEDEWTDCIDYVFDYNDDEMSYRISSYYYENDEKVPGAYATVEYDIHHSSQSRISGKAPTESEDGWKDYYRCDICGEISEDELGQKPISDLEEWKKGDGRLPAIPVKEPEEKKEENPESGDFISVAVTLMSFASVAGASLFANRKFR